MRTNIVKSLISFTIYALLSTSVVAVPISQGQDAHTAVTKRSISGVDGMSSSLYRRGGAGTGRKPLSRSASTSQGSSGSTTSGSASKGDIITICDLSNAPKVGSREYLDNILYGRSGSTVGTDDDNSGLADFDPGYKHKVPRGPTFTSPPIAEGLFGIIYAHPSIADQLVKYLGAPQKSHFAPLTAAQLGREVKYLAKAGQLISYVYTVKPGTNEIHEAWVGMKKVPGVSVKSLGFWAAGSPETTVPPALKRGQPGRKVWLDKLVAMTVARALKYATENHVEHIDISISNVMVVFKAGTTTHEIESVDLVDWGRARSVRDGCAPETAERIRANVMGRFASLY